jgi:hypothetical protein
MVHRTLSKPQTRRRSASRPERALEFSLWSQRSIVHAGYAVALVLVAIQSIGHLVNAIVLDGEASNLNADEEGNALAWLNSVVIYTGALMALTLAVVEPRLRAPLAFLAAAFAFFSLDEVIGLHELAAERVRADLLELPAGFVSLLWPVILMPLLAAVFVAMLIAARRLTPPAARAIRVGLVLLVAAVLTEAASTGLLVEDRSTEDGLYSFEVLVEEGAELAGWVLVATALAAGAYERLASSVSRG